MGIQPYLFDIQTLQVMQYFRISLGLNFFI